MDTLVKVNQADGWRVLCGRGSVDTLRILRSAQQMAENLHALAMRHDYDDYVRGGGNAQRRRQSRCHFNVCADLQSAQQERPCLKPE